MTEFFEISLPSDDDGYVSFHCSVCEQRFKLHAGEFEERSIVLLYCPMCGLNNEIDTFYTPEVLASAEHHAKQVLERMVHDMFKGLEQQTRGNRILKFEAGPAPVSEPGPPIVEVTDLAIARFSCCNSSAKLPNAVALSSGYCPYCGTER